MKKKPTPEYDSQRQQNVLLEEMNKQLKTVAEGHSGLARNIEDIKATVNEHDRRFDRIEMVVTENRTDIKVLKAGQEELKTDVNRIETRLDTIEHKVDTVTTDHEHRIQNLEAVK